MRILSTETNIFRWCSFISKFILLENKSHPFMWFACSLLMHLFILTVVIWHVLYMCMCVCAFAFTCAHTLGILDLNFSMHCCGLFGVFHFFSFFFSKWEREKKHSIVFNYSQILQVMHSNVVFCVVFIMYDCYPKACQSSDMCNISHFA